MPNDIKNTYFKKGKIKKLIVYKQKKVWHFHVELENVLPFEVYQMFYHNLENAFEDIASVKLTLQTESQDCNEIELTHYWNYFLTTIPDLLPTHTEILQKQPIIKQTTMTFNIGTDAEAVALKNKVEEAFQQFCYHVGLKRYSIHFNVETKKQDLDNFRKQKNEEDKNIVLNAVKQQAKKQEKRKESKKLNIGYNIQDEPRSMDSIMEEERRITVQGYVFISDVRKLRSGRSLLIIKATDYTDSLEIKMFSRNDEDEGMFELAKEGIWIKARGRIQTDNYSNELTMMANDIQEVRVEVRDDLAKEGERRVELHAHTTMSQLDADVSPTRLISQAA